MEDLFRFVAKEVIAGSYITSVVQIKPNGTTPKVRVLSDPQFKKELRKMENYVKEGRMPMKCIPLKKGVSIITENADGDMYLFEAEKASDIIQDWYNDCEYVPSNGAKVYFASCNGKEIDPLCYTDFESLLHYLKDN